MFTLIRSQQYDSISLEIEKDETLLDVLLTLEAAVSIDPEQFQIVPKYRTLRLARSVTYVNEAGVLLHPLRIIFQIMNDNEVELLHLRATSFFADEE